MCADDADPSCRVPWPASRITEDTPQYCGVVAPVSRRGACCALVGIITAAPLSGSESAHRICALYRGITSITSITGTGNYW